MLSAANIIMNLKQDGHRITSLRRELIDLFSDGCRPMAYDELLTLLQNRGLCPNKTTLYRELDFLISQNIIISIDLGEGKKRYERAGDHHHHLVCTGCEEIESIHLDDHLTHQEHQIFTKKGFKVSRHMLEFFGMCRSCQQQKG